MLRNRWLACACVPLLWACGSEEEPPAPEPTLWPAAEAFVPTGTLVSAHPAAFERISRWGTHVSGAVDERPDVGHRGAFGTGNGYAFAFVGEADPLNTLHSLTTPSYERRPRFYGDYAIQLATPGSEPAAFDEEWAARSLSARVLLTRGRLGSVRLDTVDFAPHSSDPALRTCFLRVVTVTNDGKDQSPALDLVVTPAVATTDAGSGWVQEILEERNLTTGFTNGDVRRESGKQLRSIPALEPGAEEQTVLFHCGGAGTDVTTPPAQLDVGALLDEEAASYQAWEHELVQVDVPDPMVADLIDGLKMTLNVQTSAGGATCPMSNYTGTWARDNIGPVLALLQLGAHDDVARMMDYIYGAIVDKGDLSNSYAADLDLSSPAAAPDWGALPTLSGRVASETPSYVVWTYGAWYASSGRLDRAQERFGLLRRCLLAQDFGPDGLLPFTGDETYRVAMSVAFDFDLSYPYEDDSWSANSTLLWLGAEKHFANLATALGMDADASAAQGKRQEVEAGYEKHYVLPDGCVSPFVDRDSGEAAAKPFEDVALKLTWAGAKSGDDPAVQKATACVLEQLRVEPGRVQSEAAERYQNFPLLLPPLQGVLTGMLPGYTLSALASAGHPEAEDAFNVMGRAASTSGNFQEYMIADDLSGLSLIYDDVGPLGDYTAKFRPWEGGINEAAMLQYLAGFEPDQPGRQLVFRPHLPNGWPRMALTGFRAGDARFDLEVLPHRVRIVSHAAESYDVVLRWDAAGDSSVRISRDGNELQTTRSDHFDQQSLSTPPQKLAAGETLELQISG